MWWWQSAGGGTKRKKKEKKNVCSGLSPSDTATAVCRRPARHHTQIPMLIILWHIFKYTGEVCIIYHFLCPQNEYLMQVLLFSPFSLLLLGKKSPNSLSRLVLRCLHVYGPFVILALKIVLKVGKNFIDKRQGQMTWWLSIVAQWCEVFTRDCSDTLVKLNTPDELQRRSIVLSRNVVHAGFRKWNDLRSLVSLWLSDHRWSMTNFEQIH